MRTWSLALLTLSVGLAGCNACATKNPNGTSAQKGHKAKSKTKAKAAITVPPKDTVTAVFFPIENGKVLMWMESRSGTIRTAIGNAYWADNGFVLKSGDAYNHHLANGQMYATVTPPGEGSTKMSELLTRQTEPPPGYAVEALTTGSGKQRLTIKPPIGQGSRLGNFDSTPAPIVWMEAKRPEASGKAVPPLTTTGLKAREGGGFENTAPEGAAAVAPAAELDTTKMKAELDKIREVPVELHLAQPINLDQDEEAEVFICLTGGMGNSCYVADTVGEETRYYTTRLDYQGTGDKPVFFSTTDGGYVMHSPAGQPLTVVRFDGVGYTTDTLR